MTSYSTVSKEFKMIVFFLILILVALIFGRIVALGGTILLTYLIGIVGTFISITGIIWVLSFLLLIGPIGEISGAVLALVIAVPRGS